MDDVAVLLPKKEEWWERELKKRRGRIKRQRAYIDLLVRTLEMNGIPVPPVQQLQEQTT